MASSLQLVGRLDGCGCITLDSVAGLSSVDGNGLSFPRAGLQTPVLWTRGRGCHELAELLGSRRPARVTADLMDAAVQRRSTMLVSRRLPSTDLLRVAVPVDFNRSGVAAVAAAVAGGPNSRTAAQVARRLGESLGAPAFMACAYRSNQSREKAVSVVESLFPLVPDLEYRLIGADNPRQLISQLPENCLLVIGAPGGNWFQRVLFGPGARLRQKAAGGVVIARSAPVRVFQIMGAPLFVSPYHLAADVLRLHAHRMLAVAENGTLVGVVRRSSLSAAGRGVTVVKVMEAPRAVGQAVPVSDVATHADWFGESPVPVVDDAGRLVGSVTRPAGSSA